jgi:hypothetical protein
MFRRIPKPIAIGVITVLLGGAVSILRKRVTP